MIELRPTELDGVVEVQPTVRRGKDGDDKRGYFLELWRENVYAELAAEPFVQDNSAYSVEGVVRGLHYQWPGPQGKLVTALYGVVFDVAVDIRRDSETFGQWVGVELRAEVGNQLWIPPGFAHGYAVRSPESLVAYKCTAYYDQQADKSVDWSDPDIGIEWEVADPILSKKDLDAPRLRDIAPDHLPTL